MMYRILSIIILLNCSSFVANSQNLIVPGKGIREVQLGSSPDDIFWALGFKGIKLTKAGVPDPLKIQAEMLKVDYDYVYNYQHIMALPVSTVYFKNDKVVLIVLSSYPEYNQVVCMGLKTNEGLNFWDTVGNMKKIYGKAFEIKHAQFEFFYYPALGLSVSIDDKEIRTMSIFNAQM